MKKEKKVEEEKKVEQSPSGVNTYFTKEVNDKIVEMTPAMMESLLKGFINNDEWIAMLKYISIRTILLDSRLRTANPIQDPHLISWSQGALSGLCDIENYVIDLNTEKKEVSKEEENTNTNPEGQI